ncbi:cupredoxin domain-containing protein [Kribbella sp. NBC_01245]|uniref:cupredoxin domain-containing protein n=1 Tax=Kribbella sp. NBC_01245 TaxID=2903578 RepID=UPI002E2C887C|nr:cupredoxin domain-containing protein [Kribbella sp. NBC_01245]
MRSTFTRGTALALLPTLGMLVLAGCGNEGDTGAGGTPSTTPSSTPSSTPSATPSTSTPPKALTPSNTADPSGEEADVTIDVVIANGKVSPSGVSVKAKAGQTVRITGTSDVEEQLHVHGYEKELDLAPGKPKAVTFKADTKGAFEIETHESAKLVAKLVVS